jgi:caa(3)-type oxidase subunit IV
MSTTNARATTYVWAILSVLTLLSLWLGPARVGHVAASLPITVAVLTMALIKARLIIQYFMEVRTAPRWLRIATDGWLIVLFGGVVAIYVW